MIAVIFDYGISDSLRKNALSLLNINEEDAQIYEFSVMCDKEDYKVTDDIKRCVFITHLESGVIGYHEKLVLENNNILSWVVSIVDNKHESYKKQYINQLDNLFTKANIFYEVVFDSEEDMEATKKVCSVPIKKNKQMNVLSNNKVLSEQTVEMIRSYLPEWEITIANPDDKDSCYYADAIVLVGEKAEDFKLNAPEKHVSHRYIWLNKCQFNITIEERDAITTDIDLILSENKWGFVDFKERLYFSDIEQEKLYQKYVSGEISAVGLENDDTFVMWDVYGLPMMHNAYDDETIRQFFDTNCCIHKIVDKLNK